MLDAADTGCPLLAASAQRSIADSSVRVEVLEDTKIEDGHTFHQIHVEKRGHYGIVSRRFSQFLELDAQLAVAAPHVQRISLPPKGLIGIRRTFLRRGWNAKRRRGLQAYLNKILGQVDEVQSIPALASFLGDVCAVVAQSFRNFAGEQHVGTLLHDPTRPGDVARCESPTLVDVDSSRAEGQYPEQLALQQSTSEQTAHATVDVCYAGEGGRVKKGMLALADRLLGSVVSAFRDDHHHHEGGVNYTAVSCCASLIVLAGEDGTASVWAPAAGPWRVRQILHGHTKGVDGVAVDSDLSLIGTSSEDTTLRLWERSQHGTGDSQGSWRCTHVLEGHEGQVYFLAFSPDVSMIASASADLTIRVWEKSGEHWVCKQALKGHTDNVYGVGISGSNDVIVSASQDKTARVWCRTSVGWGCHQVLEDHTEALSACRITKDGSLIATVADDRTCRLWVKQEEAWVCLEQLHHPGACIDLAIAEDRSLIATGDVDGVLYLWTAVDGRWKCLQTIKAHKNTIYGVVIATGGDGNEMLIGTGSEDQTAIIWRYDGTHAYKATHIRPATDVEMAVPLANLTVTCLQKASFAFSSRFRWNKATLNVAKSTLSIAVLDIALPLSVEQEFFVKTVAALLGILCFIACAYCSKLRPVVYVFSTFGVVPVVRQLATVFACKEGLLHINPKVAIEFECFVGYHYYLSWLVGLVGSMYLLLLIPFTAAEGDLSVMPRHVWLKPKEWVRRKLDKTMGLNLGRLSPSRTGTVQCSYANFAANLGLPVVSTLAVWMSPVMNISLCLLITAMNLIATLLWPPMYFPLVCRFVSAGQGFSAFACVAGLVSVVLDDPTSVVPTMFLGSGCMLIVLTLTYLSCVERKQRTQS